VSETNEVKKRQEGMPFGSHCSVLSESLTPLRRLSVSARLPAAQATETDTNYDGKPDLVDVRVKTHGVAPVHSVKLLMGFDYTLEVHTHTHCESPRKRASSGRLTSDKTDEQFGRRDKRGTSVLGRPARPITLAAPLCFRTIRSHDSPTPPPHSLTFSLIYF